MQSILRRIYGIEGGIEAFVKISPLFETFEIKAEPDQDRFSQEDIILITYGDSLKRDGEKPLITLQNFAAENLREAISAIHILPFFPYSSDDGFSVKDFMAVDPDLGAWDDIKALSKDFKLMFDYVLNHISAQSEWFAKFLAEEPGFEKLAIETDPALDLSFVTRPRSLPLLTEFNKDSGQSTHVWTTFSEDQIDLNYANLDVLKLMVEVLLFYVQQGASLLRMDAVAYLWKEIGTNCIHQPQTHDMVKLFRKILDLLAPEVSIITETNVPHQENVSYFGDGSDEAQMVYNFTLPPLLFYSFTKGDSSVLSNWAKTLDLESSTNTFFNFTASHDGIGVRPLEGILPAEEVNSLIEVVEQNGGEVSFKQNPDGSESPYELNITYVDALSKNGSQADPLHAQRFLASQSIQLVMPGVPAIYIHSLLGSRNWSEGVKETGRARSINRKKLDADAVLKEFSDPDSFRSQVFHPYIEMIRIRKQQPAFHPKAGFEILDVIPQVFAIRRFTEEQEIYAIFNITGGSVTVSLAQTQASSTLSDLITKSPVDRESISLAPYQFVWLRDRS